MMSLHLRRWGWMFAVACVPVLSHATESAVLVDAELHEQSVQVLSIAGGRIAYFDQDGLLQRRPVEEMVELVMEQAADDVAAASSLLLVGGEQLRGRFAGIAGAESLKWKSDLFGDMEVSLDDVSGFDVGEGSTGVEAIAGGTDDILVMRNGDRLTGFVDLLGEKEITLMRDNQPVKVPWESIAAVRLANPANRTPGVWATLVSGDRIRCEGLTLAEGRLSAKVLNRGLEVDANRVRMLEFTTRHQMVPLSELRWKVLGGGEVFGVPYPPKVDRQQIELHAPVDLSFELPSGADRFSCRFELPDQVRSRANLNVTVEGDSGQLAALNLSGKTPQAAVKLKVSGRAIRIRLDGGIGGPVSDRLLVQSPRILVLRPAQQP